MGKLSERLKRLRSSIPASQLKTILFDDFVTDTATCYRDALTFLGARDDGRRIFSVVNEAQAIRPGLASTIAHGVPVGVRNWVTAMRFTPALSWLPKIADRVLKTPQSRQPLDAEFHALLANYFRDDVAQLGELLGRNLEHWLQPPTIRLR